MGDLLFPYVKKCKKCGKEIFPSPQWIYKEKNQKGVIYYCSYKCFRQREKEKPKREVIIPKVGDTIKVISVYGMPKYSNRVGEVKFIDYLGQLHGTWGSWQIIPGKDAYEIIGEHDG